MAQCSKNIDVHLPSAVCHFMFFRYEAMEEDLWVSWCVMLLTMARWQKQKKLAHLSVKRLRLAPPPFLPPLYAVSSLKAPSWDPGVAGCTNKVGCSYSRANQQARTVSNGSNWKPHVSSMIVYAGTRYWSISSAPLQLFTSNCAHKIQERAKLNILEPYITTRMLLARVDETNLNISSYHRADKSIRSSSR